MQGFYDVFVAVALFCASKFTWANLLFAIIAIYAWKVLRSLQKDKHNTYDFKDLLLDDQTRKASVVNHLIIAFAACSMWYVVTMTAKGIDVGQTLIQLVAIFVLQKEVKRGIGVWGMDKKQEPSTNTTETETIKTKVVEKKEGAEAVPDKPKADNYQG